MGRAGSAFAPLVPADSIDNDDRVLCVPILVIELEIVVRVFRRPMFCTGCAMVSSARCAMVSSGRCAVASSE